MSLSRNPLSPLDRGRAFDDHFTSRARRPEKDPGHDCQSHTADLCPLRSNSVSACRLIKVSRIEEFVWPTWAKVNELVGASERGAGWRGLGAGDPSQSAAVFIRCEKKEKKKKRERERRKLYHIF